MGRTSVASRVGAVTRRLRAVVWGRTEPRLRATWRVLLAVPLLLLTGTVAQAVAPAIGHPGMVPTGLLQAGTFAVLLLGWARFVDRRRLSEYGVPLSGPGVADLGVGFAAVVIAQSVWYGLGTGLGWATVEVSSTAQWGSLAVALAAGLVALAVNVWVQETVYCAVVLRSAAEGLHARDVDPRRALLGGWVVCVLYVVAIHGGSLLRPGLVVAGAAFGLLYLLTGDVALPIGFHLGVNFTGGWVFAPAAVAGERATVLAVSELAPGYAAVTGPAIPQMALALLVVAGWRYRRGGPSLALEVATWTPR